jgi:hypothetical protein
MFDPPESIDIESLLPQETEAWCAARLQELGFNAKLDEESDPNRPFISFYLKLRNIIQEHQKSGQQPILSLTPIHTGGGAEYERLLQRNYLADPDLAGDPIPATLRTQISQVDEEDFNIE